MKKLLLTILFTLVLIGSAFAEKINLLCTEKTINRALSFLINTDDKTVSTQGSNFDPYLYSNGVFTFMMRDKKGDYLYRLNRNTGVLLIKAWDKNEEEYKKLTAELYFKILAEGKTVEDPSATVDILSYVFEKYDQKENYTSIILDCEKSEPKF